MLSSTILSRSPRVLLLAGVTIFTAACAGRTPAVATAPVAATPYPSPVAATPAPSAFDLPDLWYSQNVPAARLASLQGGLLVVGFVDATCSGSCSATLKAMAAIEAETGSRVHFVVVSSAGEQGTPATLAAFAKSKRLRSERYTVISSNPEAVANLVTVLDNTRTNLTVAQFQSTSLLSVLDYNGITARQRANGVIDALLESLTLLDNMR